MTTAIAIALLILCWALLAFNSEWKAGGKK